MTAMTVMPREEYEWTVDDLDQLPDDGLRYELLDGILLVSPTPSRTHQRAGFELAHLLRLVCPAGVEVAVAPLGWQPDNHTALEPDVMVLANRDLTRSVANSMILAVEVLSPSSRRKDAIYKRSKYEDEGVASYWIVDPEGLSIVAYELQGGRYVTVGEATGNQPITLSAPFPVTIVPADLVR